MLSRGSIGGLGFRGLGFRVAMQGGCLGLKSAIGYKDTLSMKITLWLQVYK